MKFSVLERLSLFPLLPEKGTFLNLKAIRKIREELSIDEDEMKEMEFEQFDDGRLRWDIKKDPNKEIEIPESIKKIIVIKLKEMDESGELEDRHFTLYERFIENK